MNDIGKIINWIRREYISEYNKMEIDYDDEFRLFRIEIALTKFNKSSEIENKSSETKIKDSEKENIEIRIKSYFPIDLNNYLEHIIEVVILDSDFLEYDILDYDDFIKIINILR